MPTTPTVLTDFNLYIDGQGFAGLVEEITPPKLVIKSDEYRACGMDIPLEIDIGMEKLETSFTLVNYSPTVVSMISEGSGSLLGAASKVATLATSAGAHSKTVGAVSTAAAALKGAPGGRLLRFVGAYSGGGKVEKLELHMRGFVKEVDPGTAKPGERSPMKFTLSLNYYREDYNGTIMTEIDPANYKRVIGGVDQLAARREALGY